MFRVRLFRLGAAQHLLTLTMHHIVSDAWSMSVLIREVGALYEAYSLGRPSPLEELPVQYADFAAWQGLGLTSDAAESQLGYWREKLAGVPVLNLPTDWPRPAMPSGRGGERLRLYPKRLAEGLRS